MYYIYNYKYITTYITISITQIFTSYFTYNLHVFLKDIHDKPVENYIFYYI